jgi:uncharacterized membrane protein YqaE (UPF0057 family)
VQPPPPTTSVVPAGGTATSTTTTAATTAPRVPGELETEVANMRIIGAGVGSDPIPAHNMSGAECVAATAFDVCIPPLGVAMSTGSGGEVLINCVLWLFGWFPGVIHSLAVTYTPFSFTGVNKTRMVVAQAGQTTTTGGQVAGATAATSAGGGGRATAAAPTGPTVPALQAAPAAKAY